MSTQTKNLGLIKPGLDDKVDIGDLNQNFDAIDDLLVDATEIKKGLMSSEDKTKLNQMSPEDINKKADKTYVDNQNALLQEQVSLKADTTYVDTELNKKADTTYVDTELNKKADSTYLTAELGKKSDTTYVDAELGKKADITYVDTELGKKTSKTYVDTALEKKTDKTYVDTELEKKADTEYVNDNFANSPKATVSGKRVEMADISPITHNVKCNFRTNLFDISKVMSSGGLTNNNNGTLTIITDSTGSASSGAEPHNKLRDFCPNLEVGKTYTLSANTTGNRNHIFAGVKWEFGTSLTISSGYLNSTVYFYGSGANTTATISNIQIEEGTVATPYVPYVNPTNVTVSACGKNLANLVQGVINNAGGELGLTDNPNYRSVFYSNLPKGTYVISCDVPITLIRTVISGVYSSSPYADIYTFEHNGGNFGLSFRKTNNTPFGDSKAQLEYGSVATPYEEYQDADYTPNADGTIDNVFSIYPYMQMFTDNENVTLNATYNLDTNRSASEYVNDNFALAIKPNAKGNPIFLTDSTNNKVAELEASGSTHQDGVPSPTNPVPITNGIIDHISYNEITASIEPIELSKWDSIQKRNGVWGKVNSTAIARITKQLFFYSNFNTTFSEKFNRLQCNVENKLYSNGIFCDKFNSYTSKYNLEVWGICEEGQANYNIFYLAFPKSITSREEAFKWFDENITTITYKTNETFEPLPQSTQDVLNRIQTFYPNSTIQTNDGIELNLKYIADTKIYIDNKFNELQNTIISLGGNI